MWRKKRDCLTVDFIQVGLEMLYFSSLLIPFYAVTVPIISVSAAYLYNVFCREWISFHIKRKQESPKHVAVAAINPVGCGRIISRLCLKGNGVGIVPCTCSMDRKPRLRTDGISDVVTASLYK